MRGALARALVVGLALPGAIAGHGGGASAAPGDPQDRGTIAPGQAIEHGIRGGEADLYRIRLVAGESARVVVQQQGIDLALALLGPEGETIVEVDGPCGAVGPEPLSIVAERSGDYRLAVRSPGSATAGRYVVSLGSPHPAEPRDRLSVAAQSLHARAEALRADGTLEHVREALALFGQARELWQAAGDPDGAARSLFALGLSHRQLGDLQQALTIWQEALDLKETLSDPGLEPVVLGAAGIVHLMRGDLGAAEDRLDTAAALFRRLGNLGSEGSSLAAAGTVALRLGELDKALERFDRALEVSRRTGDRRLEATSLNDLGSIYGALGDEPRALASFEESLSVARAVGEPRKEAAALSNLGRLRVARGEALKAREALDESLRIYRRLGDRYGEAATLGSLGAAHAASRDLARARAAHEEALVLHREIGDRLGEASALSHLAALRLATGELAAAQALFEQALALRRELRHRAGEADTLYGMARLRLAEGRLAEADGLITTGLEIVEALRTGMGSPELRASYLGSVRDYYATRIEILMQRHQRAPEEGFDRLALETAERARARSLLDLLAEAGAGVRQATAPAPEERLRSVRRLLTAASERQVRLLARRHEADDAEAAARQVEELTREHDRLQAEILERSPRAAKLLQPQTLTAGQIRQLLDGETLLLEYALGEERSYVWLVTRDTVSSHALPRRAEIEDAARQLHRTLGGSRPGAGDDAAALARLVLEPVADRLGKPRLAVVADGALHYIPFAALPLAGSPLVRGHEVVSLPSASALALLREARAGRVPAAETLAVLADPVFDAADARVGLPPAQARAAASSRAEGSGLARSVRDFAAGDAPFQLARLPFSRGEAQDIAALVPASERMMALDFDASRETALSPELGRFRIVHFATHGLLNSKHPELSGIVLSLVDPSGRERPGFLSALEVFDLQLNADLVVLSGCQTALGKEVRGEGLVGLTRGFLEAGASALVASLWKVDDAATAELMYRLYQGLLGPEHLAPAAALRRAQLQMQARRRWQHPYFWAAFVLQGEWR